ncbi:hypothetical protein O3M35_011711 [Rhynocoris fuscipes]|uniref:Uncharacterized protein n=1 Tax=Rhynocoris fuscipes TaxID=488301 RepID=A0AAW1CW88_9HEMI
MDISQNKIPYNPPVNPNSPNYNPTYDGYHDPNEDPSYEFGFRTPVYTRKENSNSQGFVNGEYAFADDVGQRHYVRYEAGAKTGFKVLSPFPDSTPFTANSFYRGRPSKPGGKTLRGTTSIQQGGDGSYRFVSTGPDQRRTEISDKAGNVRGSYTYLDDKGQQRTVEYMAGPNIGYRIIKKGKGPNFAPTFPFNTVSGGVQPYPDLGPVGPSFPPVTTATNDLFEDGNSNVLGGTGGVNRPFGGGGGGSGSGSRPIGSGVSGSSGSSGGSDSFDTTGGSDSFGTTGGSDSSGGDDFLGDFNRPGDDFGDSFGRPTGVRPGGNRPGGIRPDNRPGGIRPDINRPGGVQPGGSRPGSGSGGGLDLGSSSSGNNYGPNSDDNFLNNYPSISDGNRPDQTSPSGSGGGSFQGYPSGRPTTGPPSNFPTDLPNNCCRQPTGSDSRPSGPSGGGFDSAFPVDSSTRPPRPLPPSSSGGDDDFLSTPFDKLPPKNINDYNYYKPSPKPPQTLDKGDDSTFLSSNKNYYGFPHGIAIRAHVQSLDILPFGSRIPPPSVAIEHNLSPHG